MNAEETVLLLTWVNQHDPRVQLNAASRDIWAYSLEPFTPAEARQAILDHYRLNDSTPVTPGAIRKRTQTQRTTTEAQNRAITATPTIKHPNTFRARNPELWDQLIQQGAQARQADLKTRGQESQKP